MKEYIVVLKVKSNSGIVLVTRDVVNALNTLVDNKTNIKEVEVENIGVQSSRELD